MAKIITLITILIISGFIYFFLISPHLYTKKWTNLPLKLISMRGTYDNGEGIFFAKYKISKEQYIEISRDTTIESIRDIHILNYFDLFKKQIGLKKEFDPKNPPLVLHKTGKLVSWTAYFNEEEEILYINISYPDMSGDKL
jgi:hypothetical protein